MQTAITNKLYDAFLAGFEAPFTGSIPQWLNKHVSFPDGSPKPGKFDIGICPWLNDVYAAIQDPSIEVVIMEGAAQTYKTGVTETIIPYWIVNDPAKILRIHHTKDIADNFTKTRLLPLLNNCEPVKALMPSHKGKQSTDLIVFPHMDLTITGPSENFQHGFSVQRLTIDEAHLLNEPGLFEKLFRRTDQYKGKRKIVISSTPGATEYKQGKLVGDELALLVNSGRIYRRAWKCPNCEQYQIWKWSRKREDGTYSGINWGDKVKDKDHATDIEATSDKAMLECHYCKHRLKDSPITRIELEQTAKYECIKSSGNAKIVTYQWPAWVAPHNSFKDACIQYLKAKSMADAHVFLPLTEFTQQVAGEESDIKTQKVSSKLVYVPFNSNESWPEEKFRFMGVDLQADGRRPYMITAFDALGNARVINYGVAYSWIEIEQIAIKYKVQKPDGNNAHFVGVDCGHDWSGVAKESVRHGIDLEFEDNGQQWKEHFGWLILRGEHKDWFLWEDDIKRVVSPQSWYDAGQDIPPARLHFWSNKSLKNLVASIRDGHNTLKLAINTQDEALQRQLYSEYPDEHGNWKEKSKENHWWDCLNMTYAMGILAGIPFYGKETQVKS